MARRKDIEKIAGSVIRKAREEAGLSQQELADEVGTRQQTIDKIEKYDPQRPKSGIKGSITKANVIAHLGLQPSRDNGTTAISLRRGRADVSRPHDLPLFSPRLGEGGHMAVPKEASALIKRPQLLADADESYAIKMVGNTMVPRFRHNETLYVDPTFKPEDDKERGEFVFYSPNRRSAQVRQLLRQTAEHWVVAQYNPPKEMTLLKKAWPACERIVSANFLESV